MKKKFLITASCALLMLGAASGLAGSLVAKNQTEVKEVKADPDTITITEIFNWYNGTFCSIRFNASQFEALRSSIASYSATDGVHTMSNSDFQDWPKDGGWGNFFVGADIYANRNDLTYLLFTLKNSSSEVVGYLQYGSAPSADTISLPATATVKVSQDLALIATTNADSVTWTTSDPLVATVSGTDKNATVTGVAVGTAVITGTLANSASASCTVTVTENVADKLPAPVGLVMNNIGDGGYVVAFTPVEHASGYKFEYYDVESSTEAAHLVGSHAASNGAALNPTAAGLTAGSNYYVRVVTLGDGSDYSDSDPSSVVYVNNGKRAGSHYYTYHTGESYANYFLGLNLCSTNGNTMAFDESDWNAATAEYDNVFVAERTNLKNKTTTAATNAISQYNYILGKYSLDDYSWLKDFIGTGAVRPTASSPRNIFGFENGDSNNNYIAIVIIASATLATLAAAGLVLYRKRKHE